MSAHILLNIVLFLLQSTVLILFALAITRVFARRRPVLRQIVYRCTFLAVLACPLISLLCPKFGATVIGVKLPEHFSAAKIPERTKPLVRSESVVAVEQKIATENRPQDFSLHEMNVTAPVFHEAPQSVSMESDAVQTQENNPSKTVSFSPFVAGLLAVWGIGFVFFVSKIVFSWRRSAALVRQAIDVDGVLHERLETLLRRLRIRSRVRMMQNPFLTSPCLLGILSPTLLLPDAIPDNERELDAIIVHELAHLLRHDLAWLLLGGFTCALFFFQPLLLLLKQHMRHTAEEICDDEVLRFGVDSRVYAEQLLEVASKYVPGKELPEYTLPECVLPMASRKSKLRSRIERILDSSRIVSGAVSRKTVTITILLAILFTFATGSFSLEVNEKPAVITGAKFNDGVTDDQAAAKPQENTLLLTVLTPDRVSGTVLDSQGKPIAGAKIILTEGNGSVNYRFASTKEDGSYAFQDWERAGVIYVFAKGLMPVSQAFKIGNGKEQHSNQFKLQPGKTIRIKVLDRRGSPIPAARIYPERWREELARFNDGPIDSGIPKRTDQNGVWEWTWAPDDAIVYSIYGSESENRYNFMSIRHVSLTARDQEYVFTLNDLLKISGKVVDAETKEPIKEFTVIPATTYGRENVKNDFHYFYHDSKDFKDGAYHLSYDNAVEHVGGKEGRFFRFTAKGYEPFESEVFANDRGTVEYNVELKRSTKPAAPHLSGTVLTPDGKPATGAKVAVSMDSNNSTIEIRDGQLTSWNNGDYVVDVDENGTFQVPEIEGVFTVVAIHDSGVAQTTGQRLAENNTMRLSAWARIEGTLMLDTQPGKRLPVQMWGWGERAEEFRHHGRNPPSYVAYPKTDDQGRFVMERVAPVGVGKIAYYDYLRPDDGDMPSVSLLSESVRLEPGKTATVQLGGKGVSVFGKFTLPDGWKSINWKGAKVALRPDLGPEPEFPQPKIPEEILNKYTQKALNFEGKTERVFRDNLTEVEEKEFAKIMEDYKPDEQEQKAREKYYKYLYDKQHISPDHKRDGIVAADGTFRVYGVLPGKYVLRIELIVPGADKKDDSRTYFHSELVSIVVENEPLDMKETAPVFREISESKWSHVDSFE